MCILHDSVLHLLIGFLSTTILIPATQINQAVLTVAIQLVDTASVAVKLLLVLL